MNTRYYGSYKVIKRTHKVGGVEYEVHKLFRGGGIVETFRRLRDAKALCCKLNATN